MSFPLKKPRLTHTGRLLIMAQYFTHWRSQFYKIPIEVYRLFLINLKYLQSLFEDEGEDHNYYPQIRFEQSSMTLTVKCLDKTLVFDYHEQYNFKMYLIILSIAKFKNLFLYYHYIRVDKENLGAFLKLVKILKEKQVKNIDLHVHPEFLQLFIDVLPGKLRNLETFYYKHSVNKYNLKDKIDCLVVKSSSCKNNWNFPQLLLCNATRIEIFGPSMNLNSLHKQGPFHPNLQLKQLTIMVNFRTQLYDDDKEEMENKKQWKTELAKYRKAFTYLKQVNEKLIVKLDNPRRSCLHYIKEPFGDTIELHNRLLHNIHSFIDLAQEMDVKIQLCSYKFYTGMPLNEIVLTVEEVKTLALQLNMEQTYKKIIKGTFVYKGQEFELDYYFGKPF